MDQAEARDADDAVGVSHVGARCAGTGAQACGQIASGRSRDTVCPVKTRGDSWRNGGLGTFSI